MRTASDKSGHHKQASAAWQALCHPLPHIQDCNRIQIARQATHSHKVRA